MRRFGEMTKLLDNPNPPSTSLDRMALSGAYQEGPDRINPKPAESTGSRRRLQYLADPVRAQYDRLEPFVKRISPSNIYNFDKTGFQLGQEESQRIINRDWQRMGLF